MIKLLDLILEIGGAIKPKSYTMNFSSTRTTGTFTIDDIVYEYYFKTRGSVGFDDGKFRVGNLFISFDDSKNKNPLRPKLTSKNTPMLIFGTILGLFELWVKKIHSKNIESWMDVDSIYIDRISWIAATEYSNDPRRHRIYSYLIKKYASRHNASVKISSNGHGHSEATAIFLGDGLQIKISE